MLRQLLRTNLSARFGHTVYVRVRRNELSVLHMESGERAEAQASFSHERMLVGQFHKALSAVEAALQPLPLPRPRRWLLNVVLHPVDTGPGSLSGVEVRVFHELGHSTGAARVFLWIGAELTRTDLERHVFQRSPLSPAIEW